MSAWLRALALGAAAGSFATALDAGRPALAAALAAALGSRLADARARSGLGPLAGAGLLAWFATALAAALAADPRPARRLGATQLLELAEMLRWSAVCGPLAFGLRSLARRWLAAAAAELALAATAFALPLASHRGGMTHRPLEIGDWTASHAIDPALPFLAIGALAAVCLAALLLRETRGGRSLLQLGAVAVLAAAIAQGVRGASAFAPAGPRALGLTGEARSAPSVPADRDPVPRLDDELPGAGDAAPLAISILHDDWSPPSGVFYFRQSVLSQWNGQRLVRATRGDVDLDVFDAFPAAQAPLRARVAPPAEGRSPLELTTALLLEHVQPFALDAPLEIASAPNPQPERFARAFRVRSSVPGLRDDALLGREAGDPGWSEAQRRHYTLGPADPRYAELARRIVSELPAERRRDPWARARALGAWLERNAAYDRRARHSAAPDPVASFLFGDRTGYCVHFASAAAYLLRSLGLPARVALGYALPEAARAGGSALLIRAADAHAWAELRLAGAGWVPLDPSPRRVLEAAAPPPDLELQRRLGELLRRPAPPASARPATPFGVAAPAAAAALAAGLLLSAAWGLWRRLAPRFARPAQRPRAAYRAALDRLCEAGLTRRAGETREGFAARAAALAPSFAALTRAHLRAALGGRAPVDAREPLRLYTEVRRELGARAPRWRRALGRIDPFAWWRAR